MNEAQHQPHLNLQIARTYLMAADPTLLARTWQEVMEQIVALRTGPTQHRWGTAIKDHAFDSIRQLKVLETYDRHFFKVLASGRASTNVYLRRIHNFALGMEWLLKSVIPRLQWPKPVFKQKRAITATEHADKAYHQKVFVQGCRKREVSPHAARKEG